jgi:hypothetical protein
MTGSARASKRVVLSGPLAEYAPGLAAKLGRRGFLPLSVEHQLRLLSTYLGHTHPANTYWYLTSTPELMAHAAGRLATSQGGDLEGVSAS